VDPVTGKIIWKDDLRQPAPGGPLSTAGGLVFTAADTGHFYAIDARTGQILWSPNLGLASSAAPIAYEVNGTEYIAIAVGGSFIATQDHAKLGGTLVVFKLGGQPVPQLPAVTTSSAGVPQLPPLTGYTQAGPYVWVNAAKKLVVFQILAAQTSVNNGFNFDGYYNGQATFTVPQYWSVTFEYKNKAALPHSMAITSGHVAPAKLELFSFSPVASSTPNVGNVGNLWQLVSMTADHAGHYYMACLVPGHLQSGMWANFVVSSTATTPSLSTSGG
jgi:hypothetical protein